VGVIRRPVNGTHLVNRSLDAGEYSVQQATWKSADTLLHAGVQPDNIYGSEQWAAYHGSYDAWIAAGAPGFGILPPGNPRIYDPLHDPFNAWMHEREKKADYRIVDSGENQPPPEWQVVATRSYRTAQFKKRFVWTLTRTQNP